MQMGRRVRGTSTTIVGQLAFLSACTPITRRQSHVFSSELLGYFSQLTAVLAHAEPDLAPMPLLVTLRFNRPISRECHEQ